MALRIGPVPPRVHEVKLRSFLYSHGATQSPEPDQAVRFEASLAALVDNLKRDQRVGDVDFLRSVHELLRRRDQKSDDCA